MGKYKTILEMSRAGIRARASRDISARYRSTIPVSSSVHSAPILQTVSVQPSAPESGIDNGDIDQTIDDDNVQYLSDMSDDDDDGAPDATSFLQQWTHKYNIQKNALTELLKFLRASGFRDIPSDSRTQNLASHTKNAKRCVYPTGKIQPHWP